MRSSVAAFLASLLIVVPVSARIKRPKATKSLAERYDSLACAVVQLVHNGGSGTGFFVSRDGDVVTASHVGLNKVYSQEQSGAIRLNIDYKPGLKIVQNGNETQLANLPPLTADDVKRAEADLFLIKTGIKTSCYLRVSNHSGDAKIGQHVISIGFPLSAPSGALYEGFVSAQYRHLQTPVAVVNDTPIFPNYDVIRVQMPITPGVSGGPVIADDGDVIGVIVENPTAWFGDLNSIVQWGQVSEGGFNAPVSSLPKVVSKLAWVVEEYITSGAGLAVPVSFLEVPETKASPTASQK